MYVLSYGPDNEPCTLPGTEKGVTVDTSKIAMLLDELGDNPDEIAQTLREWGITGQQGDPRQCPVANYLTMRGVKQASVNGEAIGEISWRDDNGVEHWYRKGVVGRFAQEFDEGYVYSDLQEPSWSVIS